MSALEANAANLDSDSYIGEAPEATGSIFSEIWRRIIGARLPLISLVVVVIYVLLGIVGLAGAFDIKINQVYSADKTYAAPSLYQTWPNGVKTVSPGCWLGLDIAGRSVFWRTLYGTRIALLITFCTSAIVLVIGAVLGLLAGYFGGWIDIAITWLFSTVSSIPWTLLVIAFAYILQNAQAMAIDANASPFMVNVIAFFGGTTTVILALGLTDWVGLCRLMRGEVLRLRNLDFVIAARAVGLGNGRIIFRHILPNTMHIIIITFSLGAVSYVQAEVVLAFIGLGVTNKPSWGHMIDDSKLELLRGVWWEVTAATIAIFILCLALNILGDALRDALDPRLRGVK
jgi:peptide/nickel transport system permease protein